MANSRVLLYGLVSEVFMTKFIVYKPDRNSQFMSKLYMTVFFSQKSAYKILFTLKKKKSITQTCVILYNENIIKIKNTSLKLKYFLLRFCLND